MNLESLLISVSQIMANISGFVELRRKSVLILLKYWKSAYCYHVILLQKEKQERKIPILENVDQ
jgi:hypothetical protein